MVDLRIALIFELGYVALFVHLRWTEGHVLACYSTAQVLHHPM